MIVWFRYPELTLEYYESLMNKEEAGSIEEKEKKWNFLGLQKWYDQEDE